MSEQTIELSRRRLIGGIVTIGGGSVATGVGTMAHFTDSKKSTGNTIKAGTLVLSFDSEGAFQFSAALAPNQSTADTVTLVSDGTLDGTLVVDIDYSESDAQDPPDTNMSAENVAKNLEVTSLTYDGEPLVSQISSSNSPPTLYDLANNGQGDAEASQNDIIDLDDPGSGTEFGIELTLKDVDDDFQGDGINVEFTFHLKQTNGQ